MGQQVPDPPLEIAEGFPSFESLLHEFSLYYRGMPPMSPDEFKSKRAKFDKYPLFLKHTLFHGEDYLKIRKNDVTHKYFIFDDLRQKGNEFYLDKKYDQALSNYERALGLYVFVHCEEAEKQPLVSYTDDNTKFYEPKGEDN